MLLLVTLHSVAISLYLFEWIRDKIRNDNANKYAFEFIENIELSASKVML